MSTSVAPVPLMSSISPAASSSQTTPAAAAGRLGFRQLGRVALLCGAAMLLFGTGWMGGARSTQAPVTTSSSASDYDRLEARLRSLEFAASHDASAEQFRAARAMLLDLGREIDALRRDGAGREARLERRMDLIERQASDAMPSATIRASDDAPVAAGASSKAGAGGNPAE